MGGAGTAQTYAAAAELGELTARGEGTAMKLQNGWEHAADFEVSARLSAMPDPQNRMIRFFFSFFIHNSVQK